MTRTPRAARQVWLAAIFAWTTLAPAVADAQAFEKVIPKLPAPAPPPQIAAPAAPPPASQDQTVLVPELKGVVFVSGSGSLQAAGVDPRGVPGGVLALGLPLLSTEDFAAKVRPYVGKPLTRAALETLGNLAREAYRSAERPFIDVTAPPQNVSSGVIQVVVTEYRVGEITVTGNRYFSEKRIRGMSELRSGDVLSLPTLRRDLVQLNRNPFLTVNAVAKPGRETGLSDIVLAVSDRRPYRVYAGYDNQGVRALGRDEWNVGLNWGDAFGLGHVFSYQFTRSFSGRYNSHSMSDVIPMKDHRILVFGAYATQVPEIFTGFKSEGHSAQLSGRFVSDLPSRSWLKQNVEVGFDYKRTDNDLEFAGFQILATQVEIAQFLLTYNLTEADKHGQTVIENTLVFSPGDLTADNTDAAIRQLVPGSGATYVYDRLALTRTTFLPRGTSWIARALVQGADRNLPFSEQIGGGGIGVLRGYNPSVALGSEGLLMSQELRAPAFSPARLFGGKPVDTAQIGVFWDYAHVTQPTRLPDLPRAITLSSVGFNVHYSIEPNFNLQLEVGRQLRRPPGRDERETRAAIVTSISF